MCALTRRTRGCAPLFSLVFAAGFDKDTLSRNRIRKCVTSFFRDRTCVTLVRPVEDESDLQKLDRLPETDLRDVFVSQLNGFRSMLFDNARVKTVGGKPLNGPMLVALAHSYVAVRCVGPVGCCSLFTCCGCGGGFALAFFRFFWVLLWGRCRPSTAAASPASPTLGKVRPARNASGWSPSAFTRTRSAWMRRTTTGHCRKMNCGIGTRRR